MTQRRTKLGSRPWSLLVALILVAVTATPALAAKDTTTETTVPAQMQGSSTADGPQPYRLLA
jgi:hypothetical protein